MIDRRKFLKFLGLAPVAAVGVSLKTEVFASEPERPVGHVPEIGVDARCQCSVMVDAPVYATTEGVVELRTGYWYRKDGQAYFFAK